MKNRWIRGIAKIGVVVFSLSLLFGYVLYQQKSAADNSGDGTKQIQNGKSQDKASLASNLHVDPKRPVLLPSSKRITMPLFTKSDGGKGLEPVVATGNAASISDSEPLTGEDIDALIREGAGRSGSSMGEAPRTLMHSSKLSVVVIPQTKDWETKSVDTENWIEILGSNSESTLDTKPAISSNIGGSAWNLNDPEKEPEVRVPKAFLGSSKSGIISFSNEYVEITGWDGIDIAKKEKSTLTKEVRRAVMSSSKSGKVQFFQFMPARYRTWRNNEIIREFIKNM